jgi:hypothetical protein
VPRRIEIELTSARPDGTWTWRAAGAREPKGVLDGQLLHDGAKTGEVLRAEAEFELEGIVIISVVAPRTDKKAEPQRIEIIGPSRADTPGVTTQLVGRSDRRDRRRDGDDRRGSGGPREDRGRRDGAPGGPRRDGAPGGPRRDRPARPGGAGGTGDAGRRTRDDRERTGGPRRDGEHRDGPQREGPRRDGAGNRPPRSDGERRPAPNRTSSQAERSRAKRLNPGSAHRKAVMDSLAPEQQAIAEQLLRGGIPAVRTALHLEREKAEAEGRPAPNTEALLALAEGLLPPLRAAEWRDRAEAAVAGIDDISMRDLRSVVAGADQARDDETRALATRLREAIDQRVAKMHTDWVSDITAQLDAGRVVRAVRLSSRPPDASARLDAELSSRLTDAAGATMSPDTAPDLWASILEAVAESPIRRNVVPAGLPAEAPPELRKAAHQYSGSIPALAKMLGVTIPPPPAPSGARKRPAPRPAPARPRRSEGLPSAGDDAPAAPDAPATDQIEQTSGSTNDDPVTPAPAETSGESPTIAADATTPGEQPAGEQAPATGSAGDVPATGSAGDVPAAGSAGDVPAAGSAGDVPATDDPAETAAASPAIPADAPAQSDPAESGPAGSDPAEPAGSDLAEPAGSDPADSGPTPAPESAGDGAPPAGA